MALIPKNWSSFQHYKDRSPAWIKLHRGLLDDLDYFELAPESAKALPLVWLVASERDGIIPAAPKLAFRLRVSEAEVENILDDLVEHGFLVETEASEQAERGATLAQRTAKSNGFGSRHISDKVKRAVWERDGGKCAKCSSSDDIEYDHVVPVSKGGNSDNSNLQLLCRPCNRSKRVAIATHAQALRSLEGEKKEEKQEKQEKIQEEKNIRVVAKATHPSDSFFDELWKIYPKRTGANPKGPSLKLFQMARKAGHDPVRIIAGAKAYRAECEKIKIIGTERVAQTMTWLRQTRWEDYQSEPEQASMADLPGFYASFDSMELAAWETHEHRTGKSTPRDKHGGWRFPAQWPPGHEQKYEAA